MKVSNPIAHNCSAGATQSPIGVMCTSFAGVTLNRNLFETALRYLLVDSAEYTVQLYEGSGSHWKKTRCSAPNTPCNIAYDKKVMLRVSCPVADLLNPYLKLWVAYPEQYLLIVKDSLVISSSAI